MHYYTLGCRCLPVINYNLIKPHNYIQTSNIVTQYNSVHIQRDNVHNKDIALLSATLYAVCNLRSTSQRRTPHFLSTRCSESKEEESGDNEINHRSLQHHKILSLFLIYEEQHRIRQNELNDLIRSIDFATIEFDKIQVYAHFF